jgi:hypothetical protein
MQSTYLGHSLKSTHTERVKANPILENLQEQNPGTKSVKTITNQYIISIQFLRTNEIHKPMDYLKSFMVVRNHFCCTVLQVLAFLPGIFILIVAFPAYQVMVLSIENLMVD